MGMIRTIWTSKSNGDATQYVARAGEMWYDGDEALLRLGDGVTPGGNTLNFGGGSSGTYVLVTATTVRLGGIKVGSGLAITGDGTLSAISTSSYVLPPASNTVLGGIKVGSNLTITPEGVLNSSAVSDTFKTIKVTGSPDVVATGSDVLEFLAGSGIIINTGISPSLQKSVTIVASITTNLDGGFPDSIYGGIPVIEGGSV